MKVLILLFILFVLYATALATSTKQKNVESILNKKQTLIFELLELFVLVGLSFILFKQKHYVLSLLFALIFVEHINQILFCYRTDMLSTKIITLLMYIIFLWYSYHKKCYWIIPIFVIALSLHTISIISNKSFSSVTCLKEILDTSNGVSCHKLGQND
jgi:hypothetical protein